MGKIAVNKGVIFILSFHFKSNVLLYCFFWIKTPHRAHWWLPAQGAGEWTKECFCMSQHFPSISVSNCVRWIYNTLCHHTWFDKVGRAGRKCDTENCSAASALSAPVQSKQWHGELRKYGQNRYWQGQVNKYILCRFASARSLHLIIASKMYGTVKNRSHL